MCDVVRLKKGRQAYQTSVVFDFKKSRDPPLAFGNGNRERTDTYPPINQPITMPFFTTTAARPTTQAAPPPPTRSQRTSCYLARDGYFACLDRLDRSPADKDSTSCAAEQATFEKDCVSSWVCIPFHNPPPLPPLPPFFPIIYASHLACVTHTSSSSSRRRAQGEGEG